MCCVICLWFCVSVYIHVVCGYICIFVLSLLLYVHNVAGIAIRSNTRAHTSTLASPISVDVEPESLALNFDIHVYIY